MPLISVVITTHNRAVMLREALESVLAQTRRDFEIIVVDDGSTDDTRTVVEKYGDRVRYLYQQNSGRTRAINAGIGMAEGRYIAFLDDDDVWLPLKLELQADVLERCPHVDVVYGPVYLIQGSKRTFWDGDAAESSTVFDRLLSGRFVSTPSAIMLRKKILDRVGLFDAPLCPCDDWELWIRIAFAGGRFHRLDEPLVEYRLHSDNMSSDVERENAARVAVLHKVFAAPEVPERLKAMKRHYLGRLWLRVGNRRYVRSQLGAARAAWWNAVRTDYSLLTPRLVSLMARTLCGGRALQWGREVRHAAFNVGQQWLQGRD